MRQRHTAAALATRLPLPGLHSAETLGLIRSDLLCHKLGMEGAEATLSRIAAHIDAMENKA